MTALRRAIDDYLALRRRLGSALHEAARVLHLFADFADGEGATRVTTDLARRWATDGPHRSPGPCGPDKLQYSQPTEPAHA